MCTDSADLNPSSSPLGWPKIAQELDAMERSFMQEGGMTSEEFLKFVAEGSGNVANDGMFSIQASSGGSGKLGSSAAVVPPFHTSHSSPSAGAPEGLRSVGSQCYTSRPPRCAEHRKVQASGRGSVHL